jgi:hypothetical protein
MTVRLPRVCHVTETTAVQVQAGATGKERLTRQHQLGKAVAHAHRVQRERVSAGWRGAAAGVGSAAASIDTGSAVRTSTQGSCLMMALCSAIFVVPSASTMVTSAAAAQMEGVDDTGCAQVQGESVRMSNPCCTGHPKHKATCEIADTDTDTRTRKTRRLPYTLPRPHPPFTPPPDTCTRTVTHAHQHHAHLEALRESWQPKSRQQT